MDVKLNVQNRIKSKKGATLSEMMLALLILVLVSVVVAQGIPAVRNAYNKVTSRANAEVLASTTLSVIQSELSVASNVETASDDRVLAFENPSTGRWESIGNLTEETDGIYLICYNGIDTTSVNTDISYPIVSKKAQVGLYTTIDKITYKNGVFTLYNLKVCNKTGNVLATIGTESGSDRLYHIMCYNYNE